LKGHQVGYRVEGAEVNIQPTILETSEKHIKRLHKFFYVQTLSYLLLRIS